MKAKRQDYLNIIRYYKETTGKLEIDMKDVAEYAIGLGWEVPEPPTPTERLAKRLTDVASREIRHDGPTNKPYRAYHAMPIPQGQLTLWHWIDIDEATRPQMLRCLVHRREQIVNDGVQMKFDESHWNSVNPDQEPIDLPMDISLDVTWRMNEPGEENAA